MNFYSKHEALIQEAIEALGQRQFYTPYPEHPKAYPAEADADGKEAFGKLLNENFTQLGQEAEEWKGAEVSPFWMMGLGIKYPALSTERYIANSKKAADQWSARSVHERAGILVESLERVRSRFFELAYATMHTTGQSFMMSFQASGPHGNDRALEAIAMGVQEIDRFPSAIDWVKPMGKFDLTIHKTWSAIPKGIGLVIGCSTFPTWNSVPGLYADLICGNTCIVKPHPKAILAIAIVVAELRRVMEEAGVDPDTVQLAVDEPDAPITKELTEHPDVRLIDYTGGSAFGDYIEGLGKTTFTEKAGVNSVIVDSVKDIASVAQNIAFSASLYSGQMCTAPQNVFIPASFRSEEGEHSFEDMAEAIRKAVDGIVQHPKMGAGTLGGIQNEATLKRIQDGGDFGGEVALAAAPVANAEFDNARVFSPTVITTDISNDQAFSEECFGPILFLVKTADTAQSLAEASRLAREKGAITCLAFVTDEAARKGIADAMNKAFTPVSFNFGGAAFVNQHAAFSDFHVTGGNPAGNASFTDPEYINKRFVWVGNRYM